MAHACELETSVYLYLDSSRVQMNLAEKEIALPQTKFTWMDLMEGAPVLVMDHWTRFSKTGVSGDPTVATKEKGAKVFEAVVTALLELVKVFKNYDRGERVDNHL
jgi:creatinine amidohydrolase